MDGAKKGNTIVDSPSHRGWFIGRYIDEDAYRQTHDVEVKWGIHKKNDKNDSFASDQIARSMSVLIRGRFRLTFRRAGQTEDILLENEGDYAVWLPGLEHSWIAEEDSVVLTVRWPSFPAPQVEKK